MKENDTVQDMRNLFIKMLEDTSKNVEVVRSDIERSIASHTFLPLEAAEETDESVIVRVVLPGVKKEDIDISITESTLKVKAEFDFEQSFKGIYISLSDFRKGKIKRTIKLPQKVMPEEAKANFENGILKVEIPKQEKEEKHKVEIE